MARRSARPQPARLVFAAQDHDFGRVRQGDVVEAEFSFANRGDVDLSLSTPRVACDCRAELSVQGDLEPGADGVLRVRFDTDAVHGPQRRTVTLFSNDPERRSVMLTLHGEVALDVVAEPAELYVGSVTPGTRIDRGPIIRLGSRATALHAAVSDGPYLTASLAEDSPPPEAVTGDTSPPATPSSAEPAAAAHLPAAADPAEGTHLPAVALRIRRDAPLGPFTQTVRVLTSSERHPTIEIPVHGIIVAEPERSRWPRD